MPTRITLFVLLIVNLTLAGCYSLNNYEIPIIDQYNKATLYDSYQVYSSSRVEFFFVSRIDGKNAYNAYIKSSNASQGMGALMLNYGIHRDIPSRAVRLELTASTGSAAPVVSLFHSSTKQLKGEITFYPEQDQIYQVNGFTSDAYSALWIEDINGKIVSDIVERSGNAADNAEMHAMLDFEGRKADRNRSTAEQFLNLRGGDSQSLLVAKLGKPALEETIESNRSINRLAYHYDGLGKVYFGTMTEDPYTSFIRPDFNLIAFEEALTTKNPLMLQAFARFYYKNGELNEARLDAIAQTLLSWHKSDNPNIVESNAYFCRTLGKSGNLRYQPLLARLAADKSSHKKLQRYAEAALTQLSGDTTIAE